MPRPHARAHLGALTTTTSNCSASVARCQRRSQLPSEQSPFPRETSLLAGLCQEDGDAASARKHHILRNRGADAVGLPAVVGCRMARCRRGANTRAVCRHANPHHTQPCLSAAIRLCLWLYSDCTLSATAFHATVVMACIRMGRGHTGRGASAFNQWRPVTRVRLLPRPPPPQAPVQTVLHVLLHAGVVRHQARGVRPQASAERLGLLDLQGT
jgi:hypothetical protein